MAKNFDFYQKNLMFQDRGGYVFPKNPDPACQLSLGHINSALKSCTPNNPCGVDIPAFSLDDIRGALLIEMLKNRQRWQLEIEELADKGLVSFMNNTSADDAAEVRKRLRQFYAYTDGYSVAFPARRAWIYPAGRREDGGLSGSDDYKMLNNLFNAFKNVAEQNLKDYKNPKFRNGIIGNYLKDYTNLLKMDTTERDRAGASYEQIQLQEDIENLEKEIEEHENIYRAESSVSAQDAHETRSIINGKRSKLEKLRQLLAGHKQTPQRIVVPPIKQPESVAQEPEMKKPLPALDEFANTDDTEEINRIAMRRKMERDDY